MTSMRPSSVSPGQSGKGSTVSHVRSEPTRLRDTRVFRPSIPNPAPLEMPVQDLSPHWAGFPIRSRPAMAAVTVVVLGAMIAPVVLAWI